MPGDLFGSPRSSLVLVRTAHTATSTKQSGARPKSQARNPAKNHRVQLDAHMQAPPSSRHRTVLCGRACPPPASDLPDGLAAGPVWVCVPCAQVVLRKPLRSADAEDGGRPGRSDVHPCSANPQEISSLLVAWKIQHMHNSGCILTTATATQCQCQNTAIPSLALPISAFANKALGVGGRHRQGTEHGTESLPIRIFLTATRRGPAQPLAIQTSNHIPPKPSVIWLHGSTSDGTSATGSSGLDLDFGTAVLGRPGTAPALTRE
ncbi:hypothetical protein B0T11DRAFT_50229 [Plectosphaerella cucumerina]|uniref:Uncharacterized protein n=1 Tax=Plectosphaerella cucumerina TaxID=40658 RepID=A0A8K0TI24_9PEZI|nr:hypothetical protein B0T11DRAFT_50229 [Plectosphaerella cucumerina]